MSPGCVPCHVASVGFPRVSGDEPQRGQWELTRLTFSPRERG